MVLRISSNDLRLGMFIQRLGGSWLKHPFLRSSFLLTNPDDIKSILEAGIKDIWIDEEKGEALEDSESLALSIQAIDEAPSELQNVSQYGNDDKKNRGCSR